MTEQPGNLGPHVPTPPGGAGHRPPPDGPRHGAGDDPRPRDPGYRPSGDGRAAHQGGPGRRPAYPPPQGGPGRAPSYGAGHPPPPYGSPPHGTPPRGGQPHGAQLHGDQAYGAPAYGAQPDGAQAYGAQVYGAQSGGRPPGGPPPLGDPASNQPPWSATSAPSGAASPPRKSKAGRIVLIVVAVVLVVLVGGGYLAYRALTGFVSDVTGGGSLAGAGSGCSFLSADDVNATLGGTYELVELGGLGGVAGAALDSRVLPEAPTCWGVDQSDGKLVRIARYQGADAGAVFARERAAAQGTSQDQGNGISVSTSGYLGEDVQAGDEAFCTTGDGTTSAGALVRIGDKLVYVSTTAAGQGADSPPQIDLSGGSPGFATDGQNCRLSADLAAKVG